MKREREEGMVKWEVRRFISSTLCRELTGGVEAEGPKGRVLSWGGGKDVERRNFGRDFSFVLLELIRLRKVLDLDDSADVSDISDDFSTVLLGVSGTFAISSLYFHLIRRFIGEDLRN